jgi:hypothetical protein
MRWDQAYVRKIVHTPPRLQHPTPQGRASTDRPPRLDAERPQDREALPPVHDKLRRSAAYGLKAAWQQLNVARSFASLNAQVQPRTNTTADLIASRTATRRCGSSYIAA